MTMRSKLSRVIFTLDSLTHMDKYLRSDLHLIRRTQAHVIASAWNQQWKHLKDSLLMKVFIPDLCTKNLGTESGIGVVAWARE